MKGWRKKKYIDGFRTEAKREEENKCRCSETAREEGEDCLFA